MSWFSQQFWNYKSNIAYITTLISTWLYRRFSLNFAYRQAVLAWLKVMVECTKINGFNQYNILKQIADTLKYRWAWNCIKAVDGLLIVLIATALSLFSEQRTNPNSAFCFFTNYDYSQIAVRLGKNVQFFNKSEITHFSGVLNITIGRIIQAPGVGAYHIKIDLMIGSFSRAWRRCCIWRGFPLDCRVFHKNSYGKTYRYFFLHLLSNSKIKRQTNRRMSLIKLINTKLFAIHLNILI